MAKSKSTKQKAVIVTPVAFIHVPGLEAILNPPAEEDDVWEVDDVQDAAAAGAGHADGAEVDDVQEAAAGAGHDDGAGAATLSLTLRERAQQVLALQGQAALTARPFLALTLREELGRTPPPTQGAWEAWLQGAAGIGGEATLREACDMALYSEPPLPEPLCRPLVGALPRALKR